MFIDILEYIKKKLDMSSKDEQVANVTSSDDEAPEAVSFEAAKNENIDQLQKVKEQITSIRESQKKKRIERQEKFIEQKVTFFLFKRHS